MHLTAPAAAERQFRLEASAFRLPPFAFRTRSARLWVAAAVALGVGLGEMIPPAASAPDASAPPAGTASPDREDRLLEAASRYLHLSPDQARALLPVANLVDIRRRNLERELPPAPRPLPPPVGERETPEAPEHPAIAERRRMGEAQMLSFAVLHILRTFTREQIALAWRLRQGKPPAYAAADPALLKTDAGFVDPTLLERRGRLLELGAFESLTAVSPADVEATTSAAAAADEAALRLRAHELRHRELGHELEADRLGAMFAGRADQPKPFPQLVVESNDPSELAFAVEPFARRAFLSPRFMEVLRRVRTGTVQTGHTRPGGAPPARRADRLVRRYSFDRGLGDQLRRGPALLPLGGQISHGYYLFGPGQGLRLEDAGVGAHYALQFDFRCGGSAGYQKLLDFKNGTEDLGLYMYQGQLTFYTLATGGAPRPGGEHRIRLERNHSTRLVRVFLDLKPAFAFLDLDDAAVFESRRALFFLDDRTTSSEQGPGALRSLLVWGNEGG